MWDMDASRFRWWPSLIDLSISEISDNSDFRDNVLFRRTDEIFWDSDYGTNQPQRYRVKKILQNQIFCLPIHQHDCLILTSVREVLLAEHEWTLPHYEAPIQTTNQSENLNHIASRSHPFPSRQRYCSLKCLSDSTDSKRPHSITTAIRPSKINVIDHFYPINRLLFE
jgi:hypothetical protein